MCANRLDTRGGIHDGWKSRGAALTIFALLFALLAISDFLKPFHLDPSAGFVFLGTKLTGSANAIMGPLFGIVLWPMHTASGRCAGLRCHRVRLLLRG